MADQIIQQCGPESEIQDGATELQTLVREIGELSNETVFQFDESGEFDSRNYVDMASILENSINRNFVHATPERREGYLRALADLLCMVADGTSPGPNWNPIETTAGSFAAWKTAGEVLNPAAST